MPAALSRATSGRVVRRDPALEDLGAAGGRQALGGHHVLDGDRHAGEHVQLLPGGAALVDGAGGGQRALAVDVEEGVHVGVDGGDAVEVGLDDLDGADFAGCRGRGRARRRWSG